ncbi:phosphoglycolate phosphatase [Idiomarina tyrosinivorans]|uniref:phosphoglycolate phosphatase n=1 Tax=Idiomarina tyrosinivorans TaxID=1445662 RepID=A0A432ZUB9_9GAMM|nr:phosphoglycolate phosphatase [Idiomarina tyrosinivorans]RUO81376.1 phosphoglycolate phosphatase [Idiomarina tyrosinivorans]
MIETTDKPQAVLFDLDGTLLDTAPDLGAALNQVLRDHGQAEVAEQHYTPLASHGAKGLLQLGFGEFYHANQQALRKAFLAAYQNNIAQHTRLYDGVEEVLNGLAERRIKVAIVTNKPAFLTEQLLPYFASLATIDVVVSGDTLAEAKPSPAPLLYAAEQLGVDAKQCWYVGDAERDMQAGKAADMRTALAEYGYILPAEQPEKWLADHRLKHPTELLALL